jgi:hypothetical protein
MLTVVPFVLAFVASALAYMVTFPNSQEGWTNTGSQTVNWTMVDTDQVSFEIVLTNQQLSGFQSETLIALADGSSSFATVNAPSGGWQPAGDYRVDFVNSTDGSILAQSGDFNITSSSTSSATGTSGATTGTGGTTIVISTASTPSTATGTSGSSASSGASVVPTSSSAAALSYPVQTCFLGLFSLLGFVLA